MKCIHCGQELPDGSKFCFKCGKSQLVQSQEAQTTRFCPFCGSENDFDSVFCCECGKKIDGTGVSDDAKLSRNTSKSSPIKKVVAAVLILACVAGLGYAGYRFKPWENLTGKQNSKSENNKFEIGSYVKDGSLYIINPEKKNEVTELCRGSSGLEWNQFNTGGSLLAVPKTSNDGKYVYYCEAPDISSNSSYADLYIKKKSGKDEPVKLGKDVAEYSVLDNNKVIYRTSSEKMYIADTDGESNRIAGSVGGYIVDKAQKYILWWGSNYDSDGGHPVYYQDLSLKTDSVKLGDHIQSWYLDYDPVKAVVLKDLRSGKLSVIKDIPETIELDNPESITDVIAYDDDTDCLYYIRKNNVSAESYWQRFINDDCQKDDSQAQSVREYLTSKYTTDNNWRETQELYVLHNGVEELVTSDYFYGNIDYVYRSGEHSTSLGNACYIFYEYNFEEGGKINLSSLLSRGSDEIEEILQEYWNDSIYAIKYDSENGVQKVKPAVNRDEYAIGNLEGSELYIADNFDSENGSTLLKYDIDNLAAGGQEMADEPYSVALKYAGHTYYTADYDDGIDTAELYCDDKLIADDVSTEVFTTGFSIIRGTGEIVYASNYYSSNHSFDLNVYDGKDTAMVAENVMSISKIGEDAMLILTDYSNGSGDLFLYRNGKLTEVDSDVEILLGTQINMYNMY